MSCVTASGWSSASRWPGVGDLVQRRVGQLGVQAPRDLLEVLDVAVAVGDRRGDGDLGQPRRDRRIELVGLGALAQLQLERVALHVGDERLHLRRAVARPHAHVDLDGVLDLADRDRRLLGLGEGEQRRRRLDVGQGRGQQHERRHAGGVRGGELERDEPAERGADDVRALDRRARRAARRGRRPARTRPCPSATGRSRACRSARRGACAASAGTIGSHMRASATPAWTSTSGSPASVAVAVGPPRQPGVAYLGEAAVAHAADASGSPAAAAAQPWRAANVSVTRIDAVFGTGQPWWKRETRFVVPSAWRTTRRPS